MRAIAQLKKDGLIEYRGSKKTGGYYAIGEDGSGAQYSAAGCGIIPATRNEE